MSSDSASAGVSLATAGGQKLLQDSSGRLIAVYVDSIGRLGVSYANSVPTPAGSWSVSIKSPTSQSAYARPAAVLVNSSSLRVIVEGGAGTGFISDVPVTIQRDQQFNIIGVSFGNPSVLDASGKARYPTAILAHNGDILAAWSWIDTNDSRVRGFRWIKGLGWFGLGGSATGPDDVMVDKSNRVAIFPNIIEREDNYHVYLIGNRDSSSPTSSLVYNKATFDGRNWSWGIANLAFEGNAARGIEDVPSLAWDPTRLAVVTAYDISGTNKYGVFTLDSLDQKVHLDTPSFLISDNAWGSLAVDAATGDYYVLMIDASSSGAGKLGYSRFTSVLWNASLTLVDIGTNNIGISVRRRSSAGLGFLYAQGTTVPSTIKYAQIAKLDPTSLSLSVSPRQLSPEQPATLWGILLDRNGTGLSGRNILVQQSFDGQLWRPLATVATNADGSFSTNQSLSFPSTYYLMASFSGDGSYAAAVSPIVGVIVAGPASSSSFVFGAAGDFDANAATTAGLDLLAVSGSSLFLALGDLSYGTISPETAWCSYVTSHLGSGFPFELLSGNHEDGGESASGLIDNFAACLPDRVGAISGTYGKEYYFDYPVARPLARLIMISPDLTFTNGGYHSYAAGSPHYDWLASAIDGARATGIAWVIVGMHKVCISEGVKTCEVGADLANFLINRKVDLVLQGHDHNYQRSKQLTCITVGSFNNGCVADDGVDGAYMKGSGTVFVIAGIFGRALASISPTDPEAAYFTRAFGSGSTGSGHGFVEYSVSSERIGARIVLATGGPFNDTFSIVSKNKPPVLNVPYGLTVSEDSRMTFNVNATDSDLPAQLVTLSASAIPDGASFTSVPGNPAVGTFEWAPTDADGGAHTVTFTAVDDAVPSLNVAKNVTIRVTPRPVAVESVDFNPARPWAGEKIFFNASVVGGVSPYTVTWDFNGDGRLDVEGNPVDWTYISPRNVTLTVYAVDADGAVGAPFNLTLPLPPWPPSAFQFDWADFDNNGKIDIVDAASASFCYNLRADSPTWASCVYWDLNLNEQIDVTEVAAIAIRYGEHMATPFPGQSQPSGVMDPQWAMFCSALALADQRYCRGRTQ